MKKTLTKREKLIYTTLVTLLISIMLLYLVSDIYAKYISNYSGESSIDIKNWNVSVNDVIATSKNNNIFTFDIKETNGQDKIEPGDKGTFELKIKNDSNVKAKYIIMLQIYYKDTEEMATEFCIDSYNIASSDNTSSQVNMDNNTFERDIDIGVTDTLTFNWEWVSTNNDFDIASQRNGFTVKANVRIEEVIN